jgi:3-oxoacyl-[acyl-carrier protein] reductase
MNLGLDNRHFIITGSTRGIGLGIAEVLLQEGAFVMITGRDAQKGNSICQTLDSRFPGKVLFHAGDLVDEQVAETVLSKAVSKWGKVDGVIANIGAVKKVPGWDINASDWSWYFTNNFTAALQIVTSSIPQLEKTKGAVVFIGSIAGLEDVGAPLPYSAAKAALGMYAKTLSRKLAPMHIRVNTVAPGNILFEGGNWEKRYNSDPEGVQQMLDNKVPLRKFGTVEDIGNMVAFLLSDKATFITGACMVVDGGQTTHIY